MDSKEYIKTMMVKEEYRVEEKFKVDWDLATIIDPAIQIQNLFPDLNNVIHVNNEYFCNINVENELNNNGKKTINIKIKYLNDFVPDYFIGRKISHDGTLYFLYQEMKDIFRLLLTGTSYHAREKFDIESDIIYTISDLLWYSEHIDKVPGKNFPGQTDMFMLPVKCKFISNIKG